MSNTSDSSNSSDGRAMADPDNRTEKVSNTEFLAYVHTAEKRMSKESDKTTDALITTVTDDYTALDNKPETTDKETSDELMKLKSIKLIRQISIEMATPIFYDREREYRSARSQREALMLCCCLFVHLALNPMNILGFMYGAIGIATFIISATDGDNSCQNEAGLFMNLHTYLLVGAVGCILWVLLSIWLSVEVTINKVCNKTDEEWICGWALFFFPVVLFQLVWPSIGWALWSKSNDHCAGELSDNMLLSYCVIVHVPIISVVCFVLVNAS